MKLHIITKFGMINRTGPVYFFAGMKKIITITTRNNVNNVTMVNRSPENKQEHNLVKKD